MVASNLSRIFAEEECKQGTAPDSFFSSKNKDYPSADFVLCRDINGKPTAIYGEDIWDFNPYRLSGKKISQFRFDNFLVGKSPIERRSLVNEAKYLLFLIQYFPLCQDSCRF